MRAHFITAATVAALALLTASPSFAQALRTWVSGVGDDANPCSRTAPCKTFAGSVPKTAAGGQINVLDPGGFGAVTITKSITIRADHIEGGVSSGGTAAITVNTQAADTVVLQGLDLDGSSSGLTGIDVVGSGVLTIDHCNIRNFTGNGVNVTSGASRVLINASTILGNGGGVNVAGQGVFVTDSLIDHNTNFAIQVTTNGVVAIQNDKLTRSPAALSILYNGSVVSFGGNLLRGTGAPTSTISTQ